MFHCKSSSTICLRFISTSPLLFCSAFRFCSLCSERAEEPREPTANADMKGKKRLATARISAVRKGPWTAQAEIGETALHAWQDFLWICIPAHLLFVLLAPGLFQRYLSPLIPVLIVLTAGILTDFIRPSWLRYALIATLCLSNYLQVASAYPFRRHHEATLTLGRTVRSLLTPYADRPAEVVAYLNRQTHPGDALFVFDPEFPLIFCTGLRIIDGRFSDGKLPNPLPEWILSESATGVISMLPIELPKALIPRYETIKLLVPDSRRGGSVPDPDSYEYFTAQTRVGFTLYRKK